MSSTCLSGTWFTDSSSYSWSNELSFSSARNCTFLTFPDIYWEVGAEWGRERERGGGGVNPEEWLNQDYLSLSLSHTCELRLGENYYIPTHSLQLLAKRIPRLPGTHFSSEITISGMRMASCCSHWSREDRISTTVPTLVNVYMHVASRGSHNHEERVMLQSPTIPTSLPIQTRSPYLDIQVWNIVPNGVPYITTRLPLGMKQ